uniref:ATP-binding cassette domain-containing protein n=1 Tax=Eiseniibacteriota bacterium TaxID=2212470 RepID=A0A832I2C4_UNCEI
MITFEQVTKRYGERLALDAVSWHMDEGECVVVLGHSGAGKTTLLRLITHEIQPTSGTVVVGTFRGGRLSRGNRALLRRTLGIIYEDFRLLGDRTVFENVALAVRITGRFADSEVIPRVMYALEEVGLQHKQTAFPQELSAGERQRAAIARAVVNRPAVILADEPTGALEPRSANDVLELLRKIHREGAAIMLVTTRREVAETIGGRLMVLEDGRLSGATHPVSAAAAAAAPAVPPAGAAPAPPAAAPTAVPGA